MNERLTPDQVARNFEATAIGFDSVGLTVPAAMYRDAARFVREHLVESGWRDDEPPWPHDDATHVCYVEGQGDLPCGVAWFDPVPDMNYGWEFCDERGNWHPLAGHRWHHVPPPPPLPERTTK